jgi:hypothetical protein
MAEQLPRGLSCIWRSYDKRRSSSTMWVFLEPRSRTKSWTPRDCGRWRLKDWSRER